MVSRNAEGHCLGGSESSAVAGSTLSTATAIAAPITYTMTANADGTFAGQGFTDARYLISMEADTANVEFFNFWFACAYRFHLAATGQETELAELGVVR